jgi:hypothetical protein
MGILEFNFSNVWDMEAACGDDVNDSNNPAPSTQAGIYIIHNENENTTYVGYADDAKKRWGTRYEALHCLGIPGAYAKKILCGFCRPTFSGAIPMNYKGNLGCEHALIRAVVNGLLGVTQNTNTQMSNTPYKPGPIHGDVLIRVYFPVPYFSKWGKLENAKEIRIPKNAAY